MRSWMIIIILFASLSCLAATVVINPPSDTGKTNMAGYWAQRAQLTHDLQIKETAYERGRADEVSRELKFYGWVTLVMAFIGGIVVGRVTVLESVAPKSPKT